MKMLSLDTSTTCSAYAIWENTKLLSSGCINHKNLKCPSDDKVKSMIHDLYELMDKVKPEIVVTELTAVSRNVQVQRNLTLILGAILGYCIWWNIFYDYFRPTEWRHYASGDEKPPRKRKELKQWSKNRVKEIFDIELDSDDIADAILIGHGYNVAYGRMENESI